MQDEGRDATLPVGDANTLPGVGVGGPARVVAGTAETLAGEDAPAADLPELPAVDPGAYLVGAELARGGMGRILAARDRRLRREVVIKVTHGEGGELDARFGREALITARLQHPSIVRVYEAGRLGARPFYAMERVRGRSLELVLADARTQAARLALLPHAIAVADALAYAHSEGVVHRDLKPSNVLIGPWGETVVIDWGLAKDVHAAEVSQPELARGTASGPPGDGSLTQIGSVLGTPGYMAPEQARGEPSDTRSDVYALGALVYTLLAGTAPYRGDSVDAILEKVRAGSAAPLAVAAPDAPAELVSIVERAMARVPADRCTAKELADELRRYAAGQLVSSHSYTPGLLVRRWLRRYRAPLAVAAAALAVLAVLLVVGVRQIMAERDRAVSAEVAMRDARDNFVLAMAERELERDPSAAAALLVNLSEAGLRAPRSHAVAVTAWTGGLARELRGHRDDVELLAMAPDGAHVATGSDDSTIRWWSLADGSSIVLRGHQGPIQWLTISPDGQWLASCGTDHLVWLWDLRAGTGRPLTGHTDTVRRAAFSPDSAQLASTGEDGALWLWDVASATGRRIARHTHGLRPVLWSKDGATIIAGTRDGSLGFWSLAAVERPRFVSLGEAEVRSLARSRDGTLLAVGGEDGRVLLLDAQGALLRTFGAHKEVVRDVQFTPDGKKLVSVGGDPVVRIDDVAGGAPIELRGNESGVKHLDISADGAWVASAGLDTTVRVWSVTGGKPRHTFRGHSAAVKAVLFTPDGTRLVSGSEDDVARVWRLDDHEAPPEGPALAAWVSARTNVMQRLLAP